MPHKETFHQGLHLLAKTKMTFNYTMDHSKFIASLLIKKEEFIGAFKGSADYRIEQQSLNCMYMMKHQILYISC